MSCYKIHLLHHVISVYIIIKITIPHAQAHGLVKDEILAILLVLLKTTTKVSRVPSC